MAIKTKFVSSAGLLQVFGDAQSNSIVVSRDADGTLRVNGKAVVEDGVTATVNNTLQISVFGDGGNDRITLDETNGPLPKASVFGGSGNDIITGGSGADQLFGEAGNDTIDGKGGDDLLSGGDGNDVLIGGAGNDQLFGGAGDDRIVWNPGDGSDAVDGGTGKDTLVVEGAAASESFVISAVNGSVNILRTSPNQFSIDATGVEEIVLKGNAGNDRISTSGDLAALTHLTLDGGDGDDVILGGNGGDLLIGGAGNDVVDGNGGRDTVRLGAGNDRFIWDPGDGSDVIDGEDGFDALILNGNDAAETFTIEASGKGALVTRTGGVNPITQDLTSVEHIVIVAGASNDTIIVDDLSRTGVKEVEIDVADADDDFDFVVVNGTDKNDKISVVSTGSSVTVNGLAAKVTMTGGQPGEDSILVDGGNGNDTIDASAFPAGSIHLVISGGAGNDTINGGGGNDVLHGGAGNDKIDGGGGDDLVFLGEGNDVFTWNPGDGSDEVEGGDGTDTLDFVGAGGDEKVNISAGIDGSVTFARNVGNVSMHLNDIERIEFDASGGADEVVVGDLSATAVKDVVIELGAADGRADTVTVNGTAGNDVISVAGNGSSLLINGLAADVTIKQFEAGHDTLIIDGGLGNDVILGSRNNDVIDGGGGADVMFGGAGDDVFVWNPGDGSDVMDGQSGSDTLAFNGTDAAEVFDISARDGDVRLSRDLGSVTQDMDGVETIELNALGGGDTIVINDLSGTDVDNVHVRLAAAGDGDDAADTVVVNGTDGDDVITLSIENGSLVINGLASKIVIDNFDPEHDKIQIAGLGGNDVIDASAIGGLGPQLIFEGGDGNDILIGGAGNDTLLGGAGDDVLIGGPGTDIVDGEDGDDIEIQDSFALQTDPAAGAHSVFQGWIEANAVKDLHLL